MNRNWRSLVLVAGLAASGQSCVILSTSEATRREAAHVVVEVLADGDDGRPPPRRTPRPLERELGGY
jgi:hypothetical protein